MDLILKEKNLVMPTYLVEVAKKFSLGTLDFILLVYFWNCDKTFDVFKISSDLHYSENEILNAFNVLMTKKLIKLDTTKDEAGKKIEVVNIEALEKVIEDLFLEKQKDQDKVNIYEVFEKEFGRCISSMEYEIINAWISKGFSEELILGALKEAVYNGAGNSLRYIDAILYNWQKKGVKSMQDVLKMQSKRKEKEESGKELFDYNWLDDE